MVRYLEKNDYEQKLRLNTENWLEFAQKTFPSNQNFRVCKTDDQTIKISKFKESGLELIATISTGNNTIEMSDKEGYFDKIKKLAKDYETKEPVTVVSPIPY
jgi:hypothetical protein